MPAHAQPPTLRRALGSALASRRAHLRAQDGFTLIEVLASALILVLVAVGTLGALDATTKSSYEARLHTDAQALAQQDENRLRGLTIAELSNLNRNLGPYTLDGVKFYVNETATYVGNLTQQPSCTSPSPDYLKTVSTVTWTNMGADTPVVLSSQMTPPVVSAASGGGGMAISVKDGNGNGISGVTVSVTGPQSGTVITDSNGCALFGDLTAGNYAVNAYSPGGTYVDMTSGQAVTASTPDTTSSVGVTAGTVASASFVMGPAAELDYSFVSDTQNPTGTPAGAIGVVAYSASMKANYMRLCTLHDGGLCPAVNSGDTYFPYTDWPMLTTGTQQAIAATPLYPFNGTAGSYSAYAGTCTQNDPTVYGASGQTVTLLPGAVGSVTVTVPALNIHVWSGSSQTSPGSEIMPSHVYVRDTGCGVRYTGWVNTTGSTGATTTAGQTPAQADVPLDPTYPGNPTGGVLQYPAMPYGKYTICVDNGSNYYWYQSVTNNGSLGQLNIYTGTSANRGSLSGELTTANQATTC